jgi:hypothetical protein
MPPAVSAARGRFLSGTVTVAQLILKNKFYEFWSLRPVFENVC